MQLLFDVFPVITTMASIELERGHFSLKQLGYTDILYKRHCDLRHIITKLNMMVFVIVDTCCLYMYVCR